jgi:hypothetical protein
MLKRISPSLFWLPGCSILCKLRHCTPFLHPSKNQWCMIQGAGLCSAVADSGLSCCSSAQALTLILPEILWIHPLPFPGPLPLVPHNLVHSVLPIKAHLLLLPLMPPLPNPPNAPPPAPLMSPPPRERGLTPPPTCCWCKCRSIDECHHSQQPSSSPQQHHSTNAQHVEQRQLADVPAHTTRPDRAPTLSETAHSLLLAGTGSTRTVRLTTHQQQQRHNAKLGSNYAVTSLKPP